MRKKALLTSATLFVLVGVVPVDAEVIFRGRDAVGLYYAHPCTGETLYFAGWWHGTATLVFAKDGSGRYQYHQNEHAEVFDVEGGQKVGMYNKTIREDLKGFYPDGDYSYLTTFNQRMSLRGHPAIIVHTRTLLTYIAGEWGMESEIVKLECRVD